MLSIKNLSRPAAANGVGALTSQHSALSCALSCVSDVMHVACQECKTRCPSLLSRSDCRTEIPKPPKSSIFSVPPLPLSLHLPPPLCILHSLLALFAALFS